MLKHFALVAICALFVTGCGPGAQDRDAAKTTIAVIPKGTTHEFWKAVHAGAVKAAEELGVEVIWKGPLKEDDREAQIKVVEDFITRGVDGIVLAPLDDVALRAPVENASRLGIPVVIIDSALKSEEHVSFVATDNYRGGQMAGEHLAKLLDGEGKVVMLRYQEGSASTTNRENGFLDAIKEHEAIEVVSANQYGGATTESAYQASENMLSPLKTEEGLSIDGIFCPNESTTFGMLRALQESGLAGTVRFVGFDASAKLVQAMRDGEIHALTLQNPLRMGYLGVKTMVRHLRGEEVRARVDTGVTLVTPGNMEEPAIQQLLDPDLEKWLE
jgi:ribose transport system substrate-binding protein